MYAVGGLTNSPVTIQVIDANSLTVTKTISFDEPDLLGIADGTYYPYAYDPASHILFVGATYVVLAINTETDTIVSVIKLGDAAWAIGLEPWELTYINAIGLVYNPHENYLYIAHLDRSFVSIYDLNEGEFLPKAISLKGFFPVSIFANSNFSKIYSLNAVSDNISVIDVSTKTIEKIIDLDAYIYQAPIKCICQAY
ncbi:MAG: hypothetical protein H6633_05360 [Anaerolineales bacterium]|nr:hypothetical protein [Anaerolineales bacterium]